MEVTAELRIYLRVLAWSEESAGQLMSCREEAVTATPRSSRASEFPSGFLGLWLGHCCQPRASIGPSWLGVSPGHSCLKRSERLVSLSRPEPRPPTRASALIRKSYEKSDAKSYTNIPEIQPIRPGASSRYDVIKIQTASFKVLALQSTELMRLDDVNVNLSVCVFCSRLDASPRGWLSAHLWVGPHHQLWNIVSVSSDPGTCRHLRTTAGSMSTTRKLFSSRRYLGYSYILSTFWNQL